MAWGGGLVGVLFVVSPLIFKHFGSKQEAVSLNVKVISRLDILIRIVVIGMLFLFLTRRYYNVNYNFQEWAIYVAILHFYVFGKIAGKYLHRMRKRPNHEEKMLAGGTERTIFKRVHFVVRSLYLSQAIGVVFLLYLHAR